MKIPVVLPVVHVTVDESGNLTVDLDGSPWGKDRSLQRDDLREVLDDITTEHQTAVRVEVTEADGTTYADVSTPLEREPATPQSEIAEPAILPRGGVTGEGFWPGEPVALSYVLMRQNADGSGKTAVNLPPSLLSRAGELVLVGLDSRALVRFEATV